MNEDRLKGGFASAAKYCAYRERAPKQVFEKLISWNFTSDQADIIIAKLKEENFLNDERFARSFCHDKFEFNHWGKVKIRMELSQYQLAHSISETALEAINDDKYRQVLKDLAERKWEIVKAKGEDFLQRRKTADYLMRKGFEGDLVWKTVKELK